MDFFVLVLVIALFSQIFLESRKYLSWFRSEVPSVTEVWNKFGPGFKRAQTFLVTADLIASMYLVEKEFDTRSKMAQGDLTFRDLFAVANVPSLFQRGSLDFMDHDELCAYNLRIFTKAPHPCQRLRPLHRSLHQMSGYLTLTTEHLIKSTAPDKLVDLARKQTVATLVYFCGIKEGALYVHRGFKAPPELTCSGLPMATVMKRIKSYQDAFGRAQQLSSL